MDQDQNTRGPGRAMKTSNMRLYTIKPAPVFTQFGEISRDVAGLPCETVKPMSTPQVLHVITLRHATMTAQTWLNTPRGKQQWSGCLLHQFLNHVFRKKDYY